MTKKYGRTKDLLINNIENQAFGKYLNNQTNFDAGVINNIRNFLFEMGGDFRFIGRQYQFAFNKFSKF